MAKYGNCRITVGGETFDSRREYARFCELKLLQRCGKIRELTRQEKFVLIPAQHIDGRLVERECSYRADFTYQEEIAPGHWQRVVEDAKGCRTEVYKIKKKLMLQVHGIRVREV
ncbi:MAG: DUF1064 domain-containing protein [Clostridia bacterium]|nr:DUF1064 domain-containing protein [Clostridia bacterium]